MKRERSWLVFAVVCGLAVGAAAWAGEVNVRLGGDKGEVFDLADLRDGETRSFGQGERQLTAVREGQEIRITRAARGDDKALSIACVAGQDTCQVVTSKDGEQIAVRIEKIRTCVDGEGDCASEDIEVVALGAGDAGHHVFVNKVCEGAGCGGEDSTMVFVSDDGVVHALGSDDHRVRLSCPEGDATLRVERSEADRTFLCPKHSVPLEKGKAEGLPRRIVIERKTE